MQLRPYQSGDRQALAQLFGDTVRTVNRRDYSAPQIETWAAGQQRLAEGPDFFASLFTLVAEENGQILGYASMDDTGYLDHLFVHKDFQGRGAASALCAAMEQRAAALGLARVTVHASITAKPFFERRGYTILRRQQVPLRGQVLVNYAMEKTLPAEQA